MDVRRASTDERDEGDSQVSSRNSGIAGLTKQVVRTSVPFLVAGALLATAFSPPTHAQAGAHNARAHAAFACVLTAHRPRYVTPNDIAAIYRRAWEMGLKGITVFRYGSKGQQVLELGGEETPEEHEHFVKCDPQSCRL